MHLTASDFDEMRRGGAGEERLRHLAECRECAARAEEAFGADGAVRAFRAAFTGIDDEPHPEEELPLYVDGRLDGVRRTAIDEHLAHCASCRDEVDDLRTFSRELRPVPRPRGRRVRWVVAAAAAVAAMIAVVLLLRRENVPVREEQMVVPTTMVVTTSSVAPEPEPPAPSPSRKPEWERLVAAAVRSGQLQIAADVLRFAAPDEYRGTTTGPLKSGLAPSATAIDALRPTFTWPATDGATYEVIVLTGGAEVARSGQIDAARWRPEQALKRGATYHWQVIVDDNVVLPKRPAPPAIFRVMSAAEHAEIEAARRAHPDDDLLLGLLYAKFGEVAAARQHLQRAAATELVRDLDRKLGR